MLSSRKKQKRMMVKNMELSFEAALTRLETVVEAMENDKTTLEASIALYKEGIALSNYCNEILDRFESEVIILQKEDVDND